MYVSLEEYGDDSITFSVIGCDLSIITALRRIIIAEVPTVAIDKVTFSHNSTIFSDEFIAHRLGLIPLTFDMDNFTGATLSFDMDCSDAIEEWYSSQLESDVDTVQPFIDDIPIVKVKKGQRLKFTAIVEVGTGQTHSKWSAGNCRFVKTEAGYFITIESVSSMDPVDIMNKALDILKQKIEHSQLELELEN